jgi:hypothetical protein
MAMGSLFLGIDSAEGLILENFLEGTLRKSGRAHVLDESLFKLLKLRFHG